MRAFDELCNRRTNSRADKSQCSCKQRELDFKTERLKCMRYIRYIINIKNKHSIGVWFTEHWNAIITYITNYMFTGWRERGKGAGVHFRNSCSLF